MYESIRSTLRQPWDSIKPCVHALDHVDDAASQTTISARSTIQLSPHYVPSQYRFAATQLVYDLGSVPRFIGSRWC